MSQPVSDLIDDVCQLRRNGFPEGNGEREMAARQLAELEAELVLCLSHTGPLVWNGRLYAATIPPRDGPLFIIQCKNADGIWWPPPEAEKKEIKFPTESPG